MAGNIIHAIATTNAIVSGLIVIEALKLLAGAPAACQTSFLHQQVGLQERSVVLQATQRRSAALATPCATQQCPCAGGGGLPGAHVLRLWHLCISPPYLSWVFSLEAASCLLPHGMQVSGSKRLVSRMAAPAPSPACMVCGTAQAGLVVDTRKMTLQQLVDKVSELQRNARWCAPLCWTAVPSRLILQHTSQSLQQPWCQSGAQPSWPHLARAPHVPGSPSNPACTHPPPACQVLKGRLALVAPWLSCGSFMYEEGQDLEEDEVGRIAAAMQPARCLLQRAPVKGSLGLMGLLSAPSMSLGVSSPQALANDPQMPYAPPPMPPRAGGIQPLAAATHPGGAAGWRPGARLDCGGVRPGAAVQGTASHQPQGAGSGAGLGGAWFARDSLALPPDAGPAACCSW